MSAGDVPSNKTCPWTVPQLAVGAQMQPGPYGGVAAPAGTWDPHCHTGQGKVGLHPAFLPWLTAVMLPASCQSCDCNVEQTHFCMAEHLPQLQNQLGW